MPTPYLRFLPALLVIAGCSSATGSSVTLWEGALSPVPPSAVAGQVAAVSQFGGIQASVEIRVATPGETYAWRLVAGTCAAPGRVVGGEALYPRVVAEDGRTAEAQTTLPGELRSGGNFAALVFRVLPAGGEERVACGAMVERS